jgi:hypothetical protein
MTFTTTALTGNRAMVRGTDKFGVSGQTVLDTTQWNEVIRIDTHKRAEESFDDKVRSFFAPLTEATDAFNEEVTSIQVDDPITYLVIDEGEEGVPAKRERRISLNRESQILRLLELNGDERLVWVGDDLEILAPDDTVQPSLLSDPLSDLQGVVAPGTQTDEV